MLKARGFTHLAAQQVKCATKADAGPRRGLEEHRPENRAIEHPGAPLSMCVGSHGIGDGKQALNIGAFELADRQDVATGKFHAFHPTSES